ncbi:hypothetical protein [Jhaorihella thermophila]|uniref:hypothetical protein n=1 Tax=Jhaorihella thermophila TaxID=488547 RepID=UPI0036210FE2
MKTVKGMKTGNIKFLFVVTLLYLIVELSFNAKLLDVVGTTTNKDDIDQIEFWGRIISGCAITIALWGIYLRKDLSFKFQKFRLVKLATIGFMAAYAIQYGILSAIENVSDAETRRKAKILSFVTSGVQNGDVDLAGLNGNLDKTSPDYKTFMAVFPVMALYVSDLDKKIAPHLETVVYRIMKRQLGDPGVYYDSAYVKADAYARKLFEQHNAILAEYEHKMREVVPKNTQILWDSIQTALDKKYPSGYIPPFARSNLYVYLTNQGIDIPITWHPKNPYWKRVFFEKAREKFERDVNKWAERAVFNFYYRSDYKLPTKLNLAEFSLLPKVRHEWNRELPIFEYDEKIKLPAGLSKEQFISQFWEPALKKRAKFSYKTMMFGAKTYEQDYSQYEDGVQAIRYTFVPLVAFCFSLIGGIFHIMKVAYLGSRLLPGHRFVGLTVCVMSISVIFGSIWIEANQASPVIETPLYQT